MRYLAGVAEEHDCAMRVGVNCGSVDPAKAAKYEKGDDLSPMLESALDHCAFLDSVGFTRYVVSLKDSDPNAVIAVNRRFADQRPDVPLHLGVTEAGMPPEGVIKTRVAFEQLISRGIGDTIRVSLTVPNDRKGEEIAAGRGILDDIRRGRVRSVVAFDTNGLNIISLPELQPGGERGLRGPRRRRQGDDRLRQTARRHDRRDGLPRERPRRDRRRGFWACGAPRTS